MTTQDNTLTLSACGTTLDIPLAIIQRDTEIRDRLFNLFRPDHAIAVLSSPIPVSMLPNSQPPLGDYWPEQGGLYAGQIRGDDGHHYHLIAARDEDHACAIGTWGQYGTEIEGARSYRDGMANTEAMVTAGITLAHTTRALRIGGHADWYIASRHEAAAAYIHTGSGNKIDGDSDRWTSTQYSAHDAWYQDFADGNQYYWNKDNKLRARVVRRLLAD
jgi:hypothetical protein